MKNFFLFILFFSTSYSFAKTIVIDPGHGGEDHGAKRYFMVGNKKVLIAEKNLALEVAKKIKKKLEPEHKVYLTRTVDREISLIERAKIAEKLQADLFVSVHINASSKKKPSGFETYYLDNHKDSAVKKVETIENNSGLFEGEEMIIRHILTELLISNTVDTSKNLARAIHKELNKTVGRPYKLINRGVKPGLFFVLALAKRPAALLEMGFLSNSKELKRMLNSKFQDKYAEAVAKGINVYLKKKK